MKFGSSPEQSLVLSQGRRVRMIPRVIREIEPLCLRKTPSRIQFPQVARFSRGREEENIWKKRNFSPPRCPILYARQSLRAVPESF